MSCHWVQCLCDTDTVENTWFHVLDCAFPQHTLTAGDFCNETLVLPESEVLAAITQDD